MANKVFISYNHKDKTAAEKISSKLKVANLEVIRDAEVMKAGEDIESFILNALKESHVTLSIISINSLLSAWVAMESVYARYGTDVGHKVFIPAYIDNSFFGRGFVDDALDMIDKELTEINTLIEKRTKRNRGIQDLQGELQRYRSLQHNIDGIVAKFKNSLCIDLSERQFESGMDKIIADIKQLEIPQPQESKPISNSKTVNQQTVQGDRNISIQDISGNNINIQQD